MRIFAFKRTAYLDDLDNDPEVQKTIKSLPDSNRFDFSITTGDNAGYHLWNKEAISNIPEMQCRTGVVLVPRWGRVHKMIGSSGVHTFKLERHDGMGLTCESAAFWDKEAKCLWFVNDPIAKILDDEAFKNNFLNFHRL